MKLLKKKVPALFLILLVVLSLTVPALAASSTDTAAAPAAAETAQTQSDATGSKSIAAGIAIGLAAAGHGRCRQQVCGGDRPSAGGGGQDPYHADAGTGLYRNRYHLCAAGRHSDHLRPISKAGGKP